MLWQFTKGFDSPQLHQEKETSNRLRLLVFLLLSTIFFVLYCQFI
nr:MAG TPA: hypothetical protein [Caudoviricetes sp.]